MKKIYIIYWLVVGFFLSSCSYTGLKPIKRKGRDYTYLSARMRTHPLGDDNFYWIDTIHIEDPVILETSHTSFGPCFILPKKYAEKLHYDATEEDVLRHPQAAVFNWELPPGYYGSRRPVEWEFILDFPWRELQIFIKTRYPRYEKREFSRYFQEVLLPAIPDIYYVYLVRGDGFNFMTGSKIDGDNMKPIDFPDEYAFYRLCVPMWRYPGAGPKYEPIKEK